MPLSPSSARSQFVICLAGHIDHGKSSLVRALTGATVDRLPEEQRRGITIDLGFSHFEVEGLRFALIDVPGHERFVHTMVAGASGVDGAILVIAADDSVMPQTREHLAVLELLGIKVGVVVISKCDLADEEQLEFVDLEVEELLAGTFLEGAPRIRVSTISALGVEQLRHELMNIVGKLPARSTDDSCFRLSIDRAFSPAGQGAVVTGTVSRGFARIGDTLQILPEATPVRIRRLQSQGKDVECVAAGERAAVNLVGIKASGIRRGDELTSPDKFEPARRHLVELRMLNDAEHPLKHRQIVRIHLGANQATAQVLLGVGAVAPGHAAFAVLNCAMPIIAEYDQRFVLRQLSPARTIGGGRIISPALRPANRLNRCLEIAPRLASADPLVRLTAQIDLRREVRLGAAGESLTDFNPAQYEAAVRQLIERKEVVRTSGAQPVLITAQRFEQLGQRLLGRCQTELERRRPASQIPLSSVLSAMSPHGSLPVLETLLEAMIERHELIRRGDQIGLPSGPRLTNRQRTLLNLVLTEIGNAGATPPTLKELADRHKYPLQDLDLLIQVGVDQGRLVRVSTQLAIDRDALETLRKSLMIQFQKHSTGTVSELRELWQMTRKHAVPILEFFDSCQITQRAGDSRSAGPRISSAVNEACP